GQRASSRAGPCGTTATAYSSRTMVPGLSPGTAAQGTPVRAASGDTYTTLVPDGRWVRTGPQTSSRTFAERSCGTMNGGDVTACRHSRTASSIGPAGPRSSHTTPPRVTTNEA